MSTKVTSITSTYDVVIVGSGASGVHAALPLVKSGLKVLMIDGGSEPENQPIQSDKDFESVRRQSAHQNKLFLGERLQGMFIPGEKTHSSMMAAGSREHVSRDVDKHLPLDAQGLSVVQTLARGGLTESWGGACDFFDADELEKTGLPSNLSNYYQQVADIIGVSGMRRGYNLQAAARSDHLARYILKKYQDKREEGRFSVDNPILALLTKDKGSRKATTYTDMDYWSDPRGSVYRARFTLEELKTHPNFLYFPYVVFQKFEEKSKKVLVDVESMAQGGSLRIKARKLVIAAGAVNTLRSVLRSKSMYDKPVPLLVKHHVLIPCLIPGLLGSQDDKMKHSLCQLFIRDRLKQDGMDSTFVQIYSYKSLLLHKLLGFSPLPMSESIKMLSMVAPATVIADVRFPTFSSHACQVTLRKKGKKDYLQIRGKDTTSLYESHKTQIKSVKKFLRSLGMMPLKVTSNPLGSAAHYAGGISGLEGDTLRVDEECLLQGTDNVYIADSSTWKAMPAKPPALTIMAQARLIGSRIARELRSAKNL
jgi:hypothetical protein